MTRCSSCMANTGCVCLGKQHSGEWATCSMFVLSCKPVVLLLCLYLLLPPPPPDGESGLTSTVSVSEWQLHFIVRPLKKCLFWCVISPCCCLRFIGCLFTPWGFWLLGSRMNFFYACVAGPTAVRSHRHAPPSDLACTLPRLQPN